MKNITIRCAELTVLDEQVIRFVLFDDIDIEKKDAEEAILAINTLTEGKEYCLLTETANHFSTTAEAREYMAKAIGSTSIVANAICLKSLAIRLIINTYVQFHKPTVPTKTFNTVEHALEWLHEQRKKQELSKVAD